MSKGIYLKDLEKKAWNFANKAHSGVRRKFSGDPYFEHVRKVFKILKKVDTNEILGAAALLHDVVEDTDFTYDDIKSEFGVKVADLVKELTSINELVSVMGKPGYLLDKMVTMSDDALTIKLCDRLQNLSDHFSASEKFRIKYYSETKYIIDNLKKWRHLNRRHLTIVNLIEGILDMMERRYIKTFEGFNISKEDYQPSRNEVMEILDFLRNRYKISETDIIGKKHYYVIVDDKAVYISGPLSSKKRAVDKIYFEISDELSNYSEASIRRAIKDFLNA